MRVSFANRVVVHMGPHKTGTTAIQQYFFEHAPALADQGVLYPEAGRHPHFPNQHWLLGQAICQGDEAYLDQFVRELNDEIAASSPDTIVISTETLAREAVGVEHLRRLRALFPDATVEWALLFREPEKLRRSRYAEQVRAGLLAFPRGIEDLINPRFIGQLERVAMLAKACPEDAIRVTSFDAAKANLAEHFLAMLGLETLYDRAWADGSTHESLPVGVTEFFRYVNRLPERFAGPVRRRIRQGVWDKGWRFAWAGAAPDPELDDLRPFLASNRAIERLFFEGKSVGLAPHNSGLASDPIMQDHMWLKDHVIAYDPLEGDPAANPVQDVNERKTA